MELIVIGSSNMDLVINVPYIPSIGETILGGKSAMFFGGKGANQAVAASRCKGNIAFIAKVGNDVYGEEMKKQFAKENLPGKYILTDQDEPTGIAQIWVSEKGENSIVVASGANMSLMPKDIEAFKTDLLAAQVILMQLESPIETIEYVASIAMGTAVKIILNPAPAQLLSNELLSKLWMITPNESEAELLTGIKVRDIDSAKSAAMHLLAKGVQHVIITMGENGSLHCHADKPVHYPSYKVQAIDTTAAGDTFNGTLAAQIASGKLINEAIPYASAAAAISVTRNGAQSSVPSVEEISAFVNNLA